MKTIVFGGLIVFLMGVLVTLLFQEIFRIVFVWRLQKQFPTAYPEERLMQIASEIQKYAMLFKIALNADLKKQVRTDGDKAQADPKSR